MYFGMIEAGTVIDPYFGGPAGRQLPGHPRPEPGRRCGLQANADPGGHGVPGYRREPGGPVPHRRRQEKGRPADQTADDAHFPAVLQLLRQEPRREPAAAQRGARRGYRREGQLLREAVHGPAQGLRRVPEAGARPGGGGPRVRPVQGKHLLRHRRHQGRRGHQRGVQLPGARADQQLPGHCHRQQPQRHDLGRQPQGRGLRHRQGPADPELRQAHRLGRGQRGPDGLQRQVPHRHGPVRGALLLRHRLRSGPDHARTPSSPRTRRPWTSCSFRARPWPTRRGTATTSRSCTAPFWNPWG